MTISEVLADCIEVAGMTQDQAAAELGVKQSVVSRWVNGKDSPSDKHIPAIVKFTGLTEARVLDSIYRQRIRGQSIPRRVAALEADMTKVKADLRDLLELLRDKR